MQTRTRLESDLEADWASPILPNGTDIYHIQKTLFEILGSNCSDLMTEISQSTFQFYFSSRRRFSASPSFSECSHKSALAPSAICERSPRLIICITDVIGYSLRLRSSFAVVLSGTNDENEPTRSERSRGNWAARGEDARERSRWFRYSRLSFKTEVVRRFRP